MAQLAFKFSWRHCFRSCLIIGIISLCWVGIFFRQSCIRSQKMVSDSVTDIRTPKIGPQVYLGPIKTGSVRSLKCPNSLWEQTSYQAWSITSRFFEWSGPMYLVASYQQRDGVKQCTSHGDFLTVSIGMILPAGAAVPINHLIRSIWHRAKISRPDVVVDRPTYFHFGFLFVDRQKT